MFYELLFLKSLALTIIIETIVMIIFFRFITRTKDAEILRILATGIIASFATLPYLWFIFANFFDQKIWYIITGESFAVLVESIIIHIILRVKILKSTICSLTCNMVSFFIGLFIFWQHKSWKYFSKCKTRNN